MGVRDFNIIVECKNMTTGEIFSRIDYEDFDQFSGDVYLKCSIGQARLLKAIDECLDNNHNLLISKSYKNK